jgi:carboxyl-terminal processing protease
VDYTHRNADGSVGIVPDSLIREFSTHNGRKVYDGGGISPDVPVEQEQIGNIAVSIYSKNLIFDYATLYFLSHPQAASVDALKISDSEYGKFLDYIKDKNYDYTTESDDELVELIKTAKQEKYYDQASAEFDALKIKLAHDKEKDLQTFSNEIKLLLYEEIASRYFYQKGRIQASLDDDLDLEKAVEVLKNPKEYSTLMQQSPVHVMASATAE